jgi:hypothetical protein
LDIEKEADRAISDSQVVIEIPYFFPSFNTYINECRKNRYAGAKMKRDIESDIAWFIDSMPVFTKPIKIHFHWIEKNWKRDADGICYAKKFILDTMVSEGKITNDNRHHVTAFKDTFETGKENKVILYIQEVNDEQS